MDNVRAEPALSESCAQSPRGAPASLADGRSGPGNGGVIITDGSHRGDGLCRRSTESLGARYQREHQWFGAALPARGDRLEWFHTGRAESDGLSTEHPTTQALSFRCPAELFTLTMFDFRLILLRFLHVSVETAKRCAHDTCYPFFSLDNSHVTICKDPNRDARKT
jgi:hypothetical protein